MKKGQVLLTIANITIAIDDSMVDGHFTSVYKPILPFATENSKYEHSIIFLHKNADEILESSEKVSQNRVENGNVVMSIDNDTYSYFSKKENFHYEVRTSLQNNRTIIFIPYNLQRVMQYSIMRGALSTVITYLAIRRKCLTIHASCIIYKGKAYLFLGKSGRGKSTQSRLWLETFDDVELLNDDSPIICTQRDVIVNGAPWSGKTQCYKQQSAPIGGIIQLYQSCENRIIQVSKRQGLSLLLPCVVGYINWDDSHRDIVMKSLESIINKIPIYKFWCTPSQEAARICRDTVVRC